MYSKEKEIELTQQARQFLNQGKAMVLATADQAHATLLRTIINFADWRYYVNDDPVFADQEYDLLFLFLKDIEKLHPDWITPDSPTQRIANGISEKFPTIPHLVPMLSLENSYNANDLTEWDQRCRELVPGQTVNYSIEPKYDGAGISLFYENDLLVRGVTRGDGVQGEDITPNIRQIKSIPLSAPFSEKGVETIEIRGEVIIPKKAFDTYNEQRIADGLPPMANPRNAASGTLRLLDPSGISKRGLHAVLYHISYHTNKNDQEDNPVFLNHYELMQWLSRCGFSTPVSLMKSCDHIKQVIDYCGVMEEKRDNLPFEIDGMVAKVNSLPQQEVMGQTSHHPRWAMAFKFKARQATSKLTNVEFQVGRTGAITPVAKIEPVPLGGVTISSVSLFNEDLVREKDLLIGDTVLVERAGDVIPYIVKSLPELRTGKERPIIFPKQCPICHEGLVKPEGEAAWRCINITCPAQVVEHLIHFASKDAMDIRNLGDANINRFYELGWIKTVPDIYRLDPAKIKELPKMGNKSVENLMQAIENSKSQPLHRLIFGLGIRFVGETTAKTLANSIENLLDLKNKSEEELSRLPDIGPRVSASIYQFFHLPENLELLDDLARLGVNMDRKKEENIGDGGVFSGKTFLFTGTLQHLKRSEAEELVERKGGKILSGVSIHLNYLVAGEKAGSKLEKAKKLESVEILSEDQFLALLNG